jgi:transcriptional regulator with XRE-family HTH domain
MVSARHPTVRRRRLGVELRRLREQAGLTIGRVAKSLECSDSKISRIETGQVAATPRDVRDMVELYRASDEERDALIQIAREVRQKGWWHAYGDVPIVPAYIDLEVTAASIRMYAALLVPGLLQTREYASAVLRAVHQELPPEQIERWIDLRMARQSILTRNGSLAIWVILDEAVLRRPVGGHRTMREQLRHLTEMATLPNLTLQVLPFIVGEHAGVDGAFTIFGFSKPANPDVIHLEHTTGDLYLESAQEVEEYMLAFNRLRAVGLSQDESIALLGRLTVEL